MTGFSACPKCSASLRAMALFCPQCGTPVLPSVNNALTISLQQILASMKPGQAEVLRRCAIPRWFDLDILAVLRDRDDDANERILQQLIQYSFVRELGADRYTYTEDVRALLLDEWRERPVELRPVQKRLYSYFEQRMNSTDIDNRATWLREIITYDLMLASTTLAQDRQIDEPLLLLPSTIDARIDRALLRFRALMDNALQGFRLAEAEALLVAAEEQQSILAPKIMHWLRYYRGCLDHMNLTFASAIRELEHLLRIESIDQELRTVATIRLGDVLVETSAWSRAIRVYRTALAMTELEVEQQAAAHLGIGDAYNELAINAGGWYVSAPATRRAIHGVVRLLRTIGLLPTMLLVWLMRKLGAIVPPTQVVVPYQNWLLARIFRASREEVLAAHRLYSQSQDSTNLVRCEMRLIESDVVFGLYTQALARAEALLNKPATHDGYRRARIELTLAHALFASGQTAKARALADYSLKIFRKLQDYRWESRALILLGRIAIVEKEAELAMQRFSEALDHARQTGSVLSRERALYELRVWRRTHASYPAALDQLLEAEPTQRFVARYPRIMVPIFQTAQMVLIPALLILASIIVPEVQPSDTFITIDTLVYAGPEVLTFPFWRLVGILLTGIVTIVTAYVLLGLFVLRRVPIAYLQEHQPEIIEVSPTRVVKFDQHGVEQAPLQLAQLDQIITTNRKLWRRSLHMFSSTLVTEPSHQEVRIDGITSWYSSAVALISQRARQLEAPLQVRHFDTVLLRSWVGGLMGVGFFLLGLFIASSNGWFWPLAELLPPTLYATLQQLAYSGLLIMAPLLYWMLFHPLRIANRVGHQPNGALLIAALVFSGLLLALVVLRDVVQVPIFNTTLLMIAIVILAEVIYYWWEHLRQERIWKGIASGLQVAVVGAFLVFIWPDIQYEFFRARAYAYSVQGAETEAAEDQIQADQVQQAQRPVPPENEQHIRPPISSVDTYDEQEVIAYYAAVLAEHQNGQKLLPDEELGKVYHNLASAQLHVCENHPQDECAEASAIIRNQETALAYVKDPQIQSLGYENLGRLYSRQGADCQAIAAFNQALVSVKDDRRRTKIEERQRSLNCR